MHTPVTLLWARILGMILVYLSIEVGFQAITVKELSGGINLSSLHSKTKSYKFTLVDKSYQVEAEYYRVWEEEEEKENGI